ncbi:recombinase RecT [Gluconobacter cerinus]|uniref:recombinase RecT n=1 Tax=Gluconobacter cerinus TaxID=38307 RepID=UPI001B8BE3FE|nr:recombinase RecT [Gluconobacter cerinus]MBS1040976.1 recombinase RecT [Gluconobacter cerinus]MBS1047963.1 recombinase RecT [Gluconobacter cerinus]
MNAVTTMQGHAPAIQITSFHELMRFAEMASQSGMVPSQYNGKPGAVLIAVQMGSELGLAPMQSLQNIAVINGRPSVWGDALLGLVKASPVCDDVIETTDGEGDQMTAICVAKRKGKSPVEARFSVQDAKDAGLWNKQGPWKQYSRRMLQMRARGFALRDAFPDVLRGLTTAEEAADIPQDEFRNSVSNQRPLDVTPQKRQLPREERQVDHIEWFKSRLANCSDTGCVLALESNWAKTQKKAAEAGKPISEETLGAVKDLIADRYGELVQQEQQQAAENANVDLEEMPA